MSAAMTTNPGVLAVMDALLEQAVEAATAIGDDHNVVGMCNCADMEIIRAAREARAAVVKMIEAATAAEVDLCNCSDMARAHGHHFGCSSADLRAALAAFRGES